jgi:hypothetical protein
LPQTHGKNAATENRADADEYRFSVPSGIPYRAILPEKDFIPPGCLSEMDIEPHGIATLLGILGPLENLPASANTGKSKYKSKIEFANEKLKDTAGEQDKGNSSMVEENYLWTLVSSMHLYGQFRTKRLAAESQLDTLFDGMSQANLDGVDVAVVKKEVDKSRTAETLRLHQAKLSKRGFNEFIFLMKRRYDRQFHRILRAWQQHFESSFHHPQENPGKGGQRKSAHAQPTKIAEANVNERIVRDDHDQIIIYSNKGGRFLAGNDQDLDVEDETMEIDFPYTPPRAKGPGYVDADEAINSMIRNTNISNKSYREWEAHTLSQIEELGEQYLDEFGTTIHFENRSSKLLFKLKESPRERVQAFFRHNYLVQFQSGDFDRVLRDIQTRLDEERDIPGSLYSQYLGWKRDLALRQLKVEITERLHGKCDLSPQTKFTDVF